MYEDLTMGVLRSRLVQKLRAADRSGRLGIFCPVADRSRGIGVQVHAKCIIVDDTMLQIGSANLNNRSMGLDSECNLAIDSTGPFSTFRVSVFTNRTLRQTDRRERHAARRHRQAVLVSQNRQCLHRPEARLRE